jgi:hypothetical protein
VLTYVLKRFRSSVTERSRQWHDAADRIAGGRRNGVPRARSPTTDANKGATLQVIEPYKPGTWYHVKPVVNTAGQHFDLYVNGRPVLSMAPFRTNASSISRMALYANGSEYGSAYVNTSRCTDPGGSEYTRYAEGKRKRGSVPWLQE